MDKDTILAILKILDQYEQVHCVGSRDSWMAYTIRIIVGHLRTRILAL